MSLSHRAPGLWTRETRGDHAQMSSATRADALRHYALSCGLLLLPIFAWNAALARSLPPAFSMTEFWRDISAPLALAENSLRAVVSVVPFFMPLELVSTRQRTGLVVYCVGAVLYFCSWVIIIIAPNSPWAASPAGFLAPAYTPLIWLAGVALLGRRLYWGRSYRWWMFLIPAAGFIAVGSPRPGRAGTAGSGSTG